MAVANRHFQTTIVALEDLNTSGHQYHAVAVADGKLANNAEEASGILISKPKNGESGTVLYAGELKFAAGGACTKGDKLTVATSGWFTAAGSGDAVVGECKYTVTSGSNGTGFFVFPNTANIPTGFAFSATAADGITAGKAYALNDNKLANTGLEASGVAPTAISSGDAGKIVTIGQVLATYSNSYGPDQDLMVTTSGYFTAVTSGYVPNARALTGATSGSNGTVNFWGGGGMLLA